MSSDSFLVVFPSGLLCLCGVGHLVMRVGANVRGRTAGFQRRFTSSGVVLFGLAGSGLGDFCFFGCFLCGLVVSSDSFSVVFLWRLLRVCVWCGSS